MITHFTRNVVPNKETMKLIALSSLIICMMLSSCNDYYFNKPQPVDSKNTYTTPKKLRGTWYTDDNKLSTLTIGKDFYTTIEKLQLKESKTKLDSDTNTYFIGNKIYYLEDSKLKGGFDYVIKDDSVIVEYLVIKSDELGQNAFLRKFNYGYILNLKHEEMINWWNIRFIDTRNKEGVIIREIDNEDLYINDNFTILHEDFNEYLIANWTKYDFQNFIDNGGFSDTLFFLKYTEKIKN